MTYKEDIVESILELKERSGSSAIAIKKLMQSKLAKDKKWFNYTFLQALKTGVANGDFVQLKNSYKLSPDFKKSVTKPKAKAAAPKKKATTTKAAAPKKKATATKKTTATKKKATTTKVSATKKTAPKKKATAPKKKAPATKKKASAPKKKAPATKKKAAPKKVKAPVTKKVVPPKKPEKFKIIHFLRHGQAMHNLEPY